jgi:hypothetical protein
MMAALMAVAGLGSAAEAQDNVAEEAPLTNQPRVLNGRIYGIDSRGSTIVVGGTFTEIKDSANASISRPYIFKFNTDTGRVDMNFLPDINNEVDAVQISDDGQHVYVGGAFSGVNGITRRRVVKLDLSDGSVVTEFKANANTRVLDLRLDNDKLFVAGKFSTINGESASRLAAVDLVTGDLLPQFSVDVTGTRNPAFPGFVQEMDLSPDGQWIVISGSFTAVGGQERHQLAVVRVNSNSAVLSPWFTDSYEPICGRVRAGYIRDVAIDPSSSYFIVNTTAFHRGVDLLCDTATRWNLPSIGPVGGDLEPVWATYTGGDTHWAAGVTDAAVYVGGHQRWENNPYPSPRGNFDGPGAVERFGIAALDPLTGVPLSWNPSRHRGRGVEAIHFNDDFMFVGSDTDFFNNTRIERLAVLPYDSSATNPAPIPVPLPASLNVITGATVDQLSYNGSSFGGATTISGPFIDGVNWCTSKAAFAVNSEIISFDDDDAYYRRGFDGARIGSALNLSTSVGYVDEEDEEPYDQPRGVADTTNAAYYNGRIFYTKAGSNDLHWRWHGLESGIIGGQEFVASALRDWSNTTGLVVMDGKLYAATAADQLVRYNVSQGFVGGGRTVVDNGAAGIDWGDITGMFASPPTNRTPLTGSPTNCDGGGFPTPPSTTLTDPSAGEVVDSGSVVLAGTTTDNEGVANVQVSLTDAGSGLFLQADGSFAANRVFFNAVLDNANGQSTGWTLPIIVPNGTYRITAKAQDISGTVEVPVRRTFTVDQAAAGPNPTSVFTSSATFSTGPFTLTGAAIDDTGIDRVRVTVRSRDNLDYLQADGTLDPAWYAFTAVLSNPGAPSSGWSIDIDIPDPGRYRLIAKATDVDGNVQSPSTAVNAVVS